MEAKLEQARAVVAAAEAQSEKAVTGSRGEQIAGAYQLWQQARAGEMIAEKTYDRIRNLYDKEVVTAQQRDEAEARYMASAAASRAAEAQYNMALSGAREEDIEAARAQADQAHGALDEVESYLNETWIIAPVSGEVTAIYPHAGELVGTGTPVVSIADMSDMWVTLNVREDMLSGIETGDKLTLRIPALGDREAEFEVSYIKSLGSYATWRATKATSDFDAKTFEVRARPVSRVEGLRAGMSALFEIGR